MYMCCVSVCVSICSCMCVPMKMCVCICMCTCVSMYITADHLTDTTCPAPVADCVRLLPGLACLLQLPLWQWTPGVSAWRPHGQGRKRFSWVHFFFLLVVVAVVCQPLTIVETKRALKGMSEIFSDDEGARERQLTALCWKGGRRWQTLRRALLAVDYGGCAVSSWFLWWEREVYCMSNMGLWGTAWFHTAVWKVMGIDTCEHNLVYHSHRVWC